MFLDVIEYIIAICNHPTYGNTLRLAKGLTQEQLAELLTISTAAVSKWEAKNTYPDITMLFPLAEIFGVTVDELLGYDEAKAKADVDKTAVCIN